MSGVALSEYGEALQATTLAIQQVLASALRAVAVTVAPPVSPVGAGPVASVNLFLYGDEFTRYRTGNDPDGGARVIGAEAFYLVDVSPDDSAVSAHSYGLARSTIESVPLLRVSTSAGTSFDVALTAYGWSIADRSALWQATTAPLRLSFGISAKFGVTSLRSSFDPRSVVAVAGPGRIIALAGADAGARKAAAVTLATELGEPLVETQLSDLVSKYIGETEKNLRLLFDRAETKTFVLFFDETDALFGKRTEVRDPHERYAGVEVAPILQLLGTAPGTVLIGVAGELGDELAGAAVAKYSFPPE